jgi:hypothetical protein
MEAAAPRSAAWCTAAKHIATRDPNRPPAPCYGSVVQGLLQRIQHQARVNHPLRPPAHDPAREHVDHERDVDKPLLGCHVRQISNPEGGRTRRGELTLDQTGHLCRRMFGRTRGADPRPTHDALKPFHAHRAGHGATRHRFAVMP